ncbi:EpsG family protein [Eupransor demetentiae]|uniref:EpsG family protein n=1 Tax=Eupransor demetentiae TaxID=3109584 RepID=A0ABM9N4J7_9LACO|nr:hypothetical protein R54876_GBNLAHCA_00649 [Lactobacillaceae bacterium LMG 33000]
MAIYLSLFLLATLGLFFTGIFGNKSLNNFFIFGIFAALVIVSGTRYHLGGYDYENYLYFFQQTPDLANLDVWGQIQQNGLFGNDTGFLILNAVIKSLGFNFYGFTLIVAAFFWLSIYFTVKPYLTNMGLLAVLVFYKYFLDVSFIYMRQSIAVAIFLWALQALLKKRWCLYFPIVIFAAMVHFSAVILIPVYFINHVRLTRKGVLIFTIIFALSYVVTLAHINILQYMSFVGSFLGGTGAEKFGDAANGPGYGDSSLVSSLFHLAEFLLVDGLLLANWQRVEEAGPRQLLAVKLFLILLPLYSIFANSSIMVRDGFYFLFTYAVVIDLVTRKSDLTKRLLVYTAFVLVCFYGMFRFATHFDDGASSRYVSYLSLHQSIREGQ